MDARSITRLLALGRLALGVGLLAAPGRVAGRWVGEVADRPEGQVLIAGLAARDAALGLGALRALANGHGAPDWIRAGMIADAADLVAVLRARDSLPPLATPAVVALAGGSVVVGAWLQAAVD
jgi:hypothetical protein